MGTINLNVGKVKPIGLDIIKTKPIKLNRVHECTNHYPYLTGLPKINGETLVGDMTLEQLGIENDKNYVHNQTTSSNKWTIVHNLNKYPAVNIFDSAGDEVVGEVIYDSVNQVTITFVSAFKGKATLN